MMRRREPPLTDPATHPRRYVSLRRAAAYLEIDRRTLNKFLDAGLLEAEWFGSRRKIATAEILAYEARRRVRRPRTNHDDQARGVKWGRAQADLPQGKEGDISGLRNRN